jgi:hypothetical protein
LERDPADGKRPKKDSSENEQGDRNEPRGTLHTEWHKDREEQQRAGEFNELIFGASERKQTTDRHRKKKRGRETEPASTA